MKLNKDINIIVAIAKNNAIGKDNDLLWRISDDLKRFKKFTSNNTIIMGRNTFLSLPNGALQNRQNIVITDNKDDNFDGVDIVYSIDEAIEISKQKIFIIGGGMIYKTFLPFADKLYLTRVDKDFDGDVFFPEIDYDDWIVDYSERVPANAKNEFDHKFSILIKKIKI